MTFLKTWQLLLLVVYCSPKSSEQSFTLEDLKQINGSCHHRSTCEEPTLSCHCDDACIDYGDCCLQARLYNRDKMVNSISKYECISVPSVNKSVYMVGKCKSCWKNHPVDKLCQKGYYKTSYENQTTEFPIFDTPVTSMVTNVTYKNYYCAVCNEEPLKKIVAWSSRTVCFFNSSEEFSGLDSDYVQDNLTKNNGSYVYYINGFDFRVCLTESVIPEKLTDKFRTCKNYVSACLSNWTNLEIQNLCHSYTLLVHHQNVTYRNYHCAMCNSVKGNIRCDISLPEDAHKPKKNILLIPNNITYSKNCSDGQIIHPRSDSFECGNISNIEDITNLSNTRIRFINSIHQIYEDGESNNGIFVCEPYEELNILPWLTFFGFGISIVCLILHLLAFLLVPDLRDLHGKNLASFCLTLLGAYICFLNNNILFSANNVGCKILACFTYYFSLSSLLWMNVIAFDIFRAPFQLIESGPQIPSEKLLKKFFFYSIYAWTVPGIALMFVVVIDNVNPSLVFESYNPLLGEGVSFCWFGQGWVTFTYFYIPFAVIMLLNVIFLLWITIIVKNLRHVSFTQEYSQILKLHWKLAVLVGIGWVSAFVAGFYPNHILVNAIFIAMNVFQGLYIFLAYTCTKEVLNYLKNFAKYPIERTSRLSRVSTGQANQAEVMYFPVSGNLKILQNFRQKLIN